MYINISKITASALVAAVAEFVPLMQDSYMDLGGHLSRAEVFLFVFLLYLNLDLQATCIPWVRNYHVFFQEHVPILLGDSR